MNGRDGFLDGVLGGASTTFLVVTTLVSLVILALPTWYVVSGLRDRARTRTWTPTTARLLSTRTVVRSSSDHSRTAVLGRWGYRAADGSEHTGEGDVTTARIERDPDGDTVLVLVDPTDPRRSQPLRDPLSMPERVLTRALTVMFFLGGIALLLSSAGPLLTR